MKKNTIIWIIIAVAVAVIVLVIVNTQMEKKKRFDWTQTYDYEKNEPYGTKYIYAMLKGYFDDYDLVDVDENFSQSGLAEEEDPSIYIFIGENPGWSYSDCSDFLDYIAKGNQGFISARNIPGDLMNMINNWYSKKYQGNNYFTALNSKISFEDDPDKVFTFNFRERDFDSYYNWDFFGTIITEHEVLGYVNEYANFIKINYGEGVLFLHSTPVAFTNFHMIEEYGFEHASRVFSNLRPAKIYWDTQKRRKFEEEGKRPSVSPLSYILAQESLRWAWYLMILLVFLFFLFRSKRRQRVVPVILPNINTSLEFAKTIGRLYYKQNDHQKLAGYKVRNFMLFVRNRYRISTKVIDDQFAERLAEKSEIPKIDIQYIINTINYINDNQISGDLLIQFHQALDAFYKNCK